MKHFKSLTELHRENGFTLPENPLFGLVRCNKTCTIGDREFSSDFYMIGLKKLISGVFLYGRTKYDHENGSLSFVKPQQIIQLKNLEFDTDGFLLFFHEDYLNGHPLHTKIKTYSYFDYETSEALHVSPREEEIIWELFRKIETEYFNNQDEFSREIILGHIDAIMKYSQRFYKRQFMNRTVVSEKMVSRFQKILTAYFEKGLPDDKGLPTVASLAAQLHISPRYLSDMLKQETGKTAIELIHSHLISAAKNMLRGEDHTISEIAYTLGFENLPYFSRLFKKETGISPNQFKKQLLN